MKLSIEWLISMTFKGNGKEEKVNKLIKQLKSKVKPSGQRSMKYP